MPILQRMVTLAFIAAVLALANLPADAAQSPDEKLYEQLAKLPAAARERALVDGARKEGTVVIVHTYRGKEARDHIALFHARYPWLKIDESDVGSQDAAQRLFAEETAGRHLTDVVNLAVPDLVDLLRNAILARYPTPATATILPQYRQFLDPEHRWTPWEFSEHGISYNTNLVPPAKAPKSWSDLCNPAFKGQASYDPGETRFLVGLWEMLGDAGTQKLLQCIGANQPIVQRGHDQRMQLMLAGDHAVQGDNYIFLGVAAKRRNPATPFAYVTTAPILGWADAMVINKNAPHPYAAALFADWCLSKESQNYVASLLRGPLAQKHPFLPANIKIVPVGIVQKDVVIRLQGWWSQYVSKGK
jgi:iron(III) transport system substrate-binding protein